MRQRRLHLPAVAEPLGRRQVDAVVDLVVRVRHRDVADARRPRAAVADGVVRRAEPGHRIGVGQRPGVDLRQRVTRRARLVAERVGRRAAIVLAVDVVDADRQVRDQLVLDPDDGLTRPADLRARIDDVAGRREARRSLNRERCSRSASRSARWPGRARRGWRRSSTTRRPSCCTRRSTGSGPSVKRGLR